MNISLASWARKVSFNADGKVEVERLLDHGYDAVEVDLPAVISVVKEINEPRLPSFKAKLRAKKEPIPVWGLADLGLNADEVGLAGSFTQVVKVFPPPARGTSETWEGTPADLAARLWNRLQEMSKAAI